MPDFMGFYGIEISIKGQKKFHISIKVE